MTHACNYCVQSRTHAITVTTSSTINDADIDNVEDAANKVDAGHNDKINKTTYDNDDADDNICDGDKNSREEDDGNNIRDNDADNNISDNNADNNIRDNDTDNISDNDADNIIKHDDVNADNTIIDKDADNNISDDDADNSNDADSNNADDYAWTQRIE